MDKCAEQALDVLLRHGLISIVSADHALSVTSAEGVAASDIATGMRLCEAVPALFGMERAILELATDAPGLRLTMAGIAMVTGLGHAERRDYVVVHDAATGCFVLSITPSHALDEHSIELEQQVRREQQLRDQLAAQAGAIQAANAHLRRSNADLVNFTRIISHDLKAPMRAIRYSTEDITEKLAGGEDPTQIEALAELSQQSRRLSRMVTDLLTYSRLDDKSAAAGAVDCHELMAEIARSLPRPPGLDLEIRGAWPTVTTIGALLDVVLRNLLDNAIKHHDRGAGLITVGCTAEAGALVVEFMDDGPGIPKAYQEAVVQPFIKVEPDRDEASGLGLSMVHKVIMEAGGALDIGGRPDGCRGTRIVVRWPFVAVDK